MDKDNQYIDELVDSSPYVDDQAKEQCKEYFKQIPTDLDLGDWFFSSSIPQCVYQGDIVDKFDLVYQEVVDDQVNFRVLEDIPCILLSNTCNMDLKEKTREKFVSAAPVFSYKEFSETKLSDKYTKDEWQAFLRSVKGNQITDILYIPGKNGLDDSVIFLDRISSFDPNILQIKLKKGHTQRILSLSQIGWYYFLIKLTYHFARYDVDCHAILPKQYHSILSVVDEPSKKVAKKGKGLAAPGPFDSRQQSTAPDYPLTPESPRVRLRFIRI